MTEAEKFLTFMSQFDFTAKKIDSFLEEMDTPSIENFFAIENLDKLVKSDTLAHMRERASEMNLRSYFKNLEVSGVTVLTRFSDNWPSKLVGIDDEPAFLFCKGDLSLLEKPSVSIVGTRSPSNYGRLITDRFAADLAREGVVIISGLAYGVDSISHRKALEVGGKTIAVLGGGFNNIYPAEHTTLANEIAEKGLLISEYCPSTKVSKYTFPHRNRIIAALADAVLITEAGLKSGTTHTKDYALDYGRALCCVPGNITSDKSELTNRLIASQQCQCVLTAKDILTTLGFSGEVKPQKRVLQLGFEEQKIADLLQNGEKDIDFLAENANLSVISLNSYLTTMEIRGIIKRMPGGYFALA